MNKSKAEKMCEALIHKVSKETWALQHLEQEFFVKGKKESVVFQKLHDLFWGWRRKQILDRDKHRCVECGSPFGVSVDHIKNRSQGGTHNTNNLQTLCNQCHSDKTYLRGKWKPVKDTK